MSTAPTFQEQSHPFLGHVPWSYLPLSVQMLSRDDVIVLEDSSIVVKVGFHLESNLSHGIQHCSVEARMHFEEVDVLKLLL